ncbi:MAG: prepilin-type N-terminal cleavage/methylation domain-containing protein [Fimbriimonadaceae bacterium]
MISRRSRKSGFTLAEVVVASVVSVVVLTSVVTLFITVIAAWARGETTMGTEGETSQIISRVSDELREAMWVSVDGDGYGLTYRKPKKAVGGNFEIPVVWDGIDRRIYLSGTDLKIFDGTSTRILSKNVLKNDPFRLGTHMNQMKKSNQTVAVEGAPTYKIFVPNSTALVSEITVTVVTGAKGGRPGEWSRAKKRDRVLLRNVPELIK